MFISNERSQKLTISQYSRTLNTMFELHPQLKADTITLGYFDLSHILLMNNASVPWLILVPQIAELTEWYHLSEQEQRQLHDESMLLSRLLMQEFEGDKLNTGALGNLVPQLHLHHVVRFKTDPAWPAPVWGNLAANPYTRTQLDTQVSRLQTLLSDQSSLTFIM